MKHVAPALFALSWLFAGCQGQPPATDQDQGQDQDQDQDQNQDQDPATTTATATPDTLAGPEIVAAPGQGDVAALVKAELARAHGHTVVVYVSASWCEPCVHLEHALESGRLQRDFPGLRLFKFDYDRDEERLARAGYTTTLIPLIVVPEPDGRAGARRLEGSIKGPEAVATNLVPRLRRLLAR